MIKYCKVCNMWPKTTLLPVWARDTKSLDTPARPKPITEVDVHSRVRDGETAQFSLNQTPVSNPKEVFPTGSCTCMSVGRGVWRVCFPSVFHSLTCAYYGETKGKNIRMLQHVSKTRGR